MVCPGPVLTSAALAATVWGCKRKGNSGPFTHLTLFWWGQGVDSQGREVVLPGMMRAGNGIPKEDWWLVWRFQICIASGKLMIQVEDMKEGGGKSFSETMWKDPWGNSACCHHWHFPMDAWDSEYYHPSLRFGISSLQLHHGICHSPFTEHSPPLPLN